MTLKNLLEQLVEEETKKKPLSHRIVETLIVLIIALAIFPLLNAGLRRVDKDYDKRWVKWDVRIDHLFNKANN